VRAMGASAFVNLGGRRVGGGISRGYELSRVPFTVRSFGNDNSNVCFIMAEYGWGKVSLSCLWWSGDAWPSGL
jgi:hypothetical protein